MFAYGAKEQNILREVEQSLWKYYQKIACSQLSDQGINNHGLIMYTSGAREHKYISMIWEASVISSSHGYQFYNKYKFLNLTDNVF